MAIIFLILSTIILIVGFAYDSMIEGRCISCGKGLIERGSVSFPCPDCGTIIKRCGSCRERSAKYVCPECGFEGP